MLTLSAAPDVATIMDHDRADPLIFKINPRRLIPESNT